MSAAVARSRVVGRSPLSEATDGVAGLTVRAISTRLTLTGELDLDGVDSLRDCMLDQITYGLPCLILDVGELQFVDAVGVGILTALAEHFADIGVGMLVVRPQPAVRRAFDVANAVGPLRFRVIA